MSYRLIPKVLTFILIAFFTLPGIFIEVWLPEAKAMDAERQIEENRRIWFELQGQTHNFNAIPTEFQANNNLVVGIYEPDFPPEHILTDLEMTLGKTIDVVSWYQKWSDNPVTNKLRIVCGLGKTPLINWEAWAGHDVPDPYPLEEIASGTFDNLIIDQLSQITQTCPDQNILIRFNHEMNTPRGQILWYPWQGRPEQFITAWQRVVTVAHSVNPRIKFIWSPAWANEDAAAYFPGNDFVDYVGPTILNFWPVPQQTPWRSFSELYEPQRPVLLSFGEPVFIPELATGEGPIPNSKAIWINEFFNYVSDHPEIAGFVWYNEFHSREFEDIVWRLDSSESALDAFISGLHSLP